MTCIGLGFARGRFAFEIGGGATAGQRACGLAGSLNEIGVGTTDEVAPPSEPSRPISGTRLSSWWLISKGDQPTHPDSFRVRAMDGSCSQGGRQTPSTSGRFAYSRCASPI